MPKNLKTQHEENHLRHTIIKLREELEKSIITKEKDIQSAINNDQITIRQLEKTIQELRVKNEKDRIWGRRSNSKSHCRNIH